MTTLFRPLARAAVLATLLLVLSAAPAQASVCGQRVLDDWYADGEVATTYPIHCYREAIADLPEDVQSYSSAEDDISAAMLKAIAAKEGKKNGGTPPNGKSGGSGGGGSGGGSGGSGGGGSGGSGGSGGLDNGGGSGDGTGTNPASAMEDRSGSGPVTQAIDKIGPSSADSFPLALVIVGVLGLLLLVAGGASFAKQRFRGRRLRPARRRI